MRNKKNWLGVGLLLVIVAATVTVVAVHAKSAAPKPLPPAAPEGTPTPEETPLPEAGSYLELEDVAYYLHTYCLYNHR